MSFPFDPNDPAVHRWLVELNVALDDMHTVFKDMARRKRKRDLGPRQHVALFKGGRRNATSLLGRRAPRAPPAPAPAPATHWSRYRAWSEPRASGRAEQASREDAFKWARLLRSPRWRSAHSTRGTERVCWNHCTMILSERP